MNLSTTKWTAIGPAPVDTPNVSLGFSAGRIEVAAADPSNIDNMYVGANGGGVWKTGVWTSPSPFWLVTSDDQPSINFGGYHPLAIHPAQQGMVLGLVSGPGAGVLKSINYGLSWQLLANNLFEGAALSSIAVHRTNLKIMYLSVWRGGSFCSPGVYKSTDGGTTWQNLTAFHVGFVTDVIIAKYDSKVLFAGMIPGDNNAGVSTSGVYKSTDQGASWHLNSGNGLPIDMFVGGAIRLESANQKGWIYVTVFNMDIYGNLSVKRFRTINNGQLWHPLTATPGTPELRSWHVVLGVDPKNKKHIFANDAYSLFESTDAGQSWTRADEIGDDWVNLEFDSRDTVVVTADRNIYHYDPVHKKWEQRSGNLQVTQLYDITLTPQSSDLCYGIAQDHTASMKFGGSLLWNNMPGGSGETGKILVDPKNSNLLYASNPLDSPAHLVQRSINGGGAWTVIHTDNSFSAEDYNLAYSVQKSFTMDPSNPKRLLLGLTMVFECKDATVANTVWSAISGVLSPNPDVGSQYITALGVAASDAKVIYAATADGHVWTTINDGANWTENDTGLMGGGVGKVVDLRIDPSDSKRVFAVTNGAAGENIWYLDPATGKWKNISGDMPWNLGVASIAADWRYQPNVLYVGSARGVYHSIDMGVHWKKHALDLPNATVTDLETIPSANILAAGTMGRGVFEILLMDPKRRGVPPPENPLPARPARLPDVVAYTHVAELNVLPGKMRGQALVDARARSVSRSREKK